MWANSRSELNLNCHNYVGNVLAFSLEHYLHKDAFKWDYVVFMTSEVEMIWKPTHFSVCPGVFRNGGSCGRSFFSGWKLIYWESSDIPATSLVFSVCLYIYYVTLPTCLLSYYPQCLLGADRNVSISLQVLTTRSLLVSMLLLPVLPLNTKNFVYTNSHVVNTHSHTSSMWMHINTVQYFFCHVMWNEENRIPLFTSIKSLQALGECRHQCLEKEDHFLMVPLKICNMREFKSIFFFQFWFPQCTVKVFLKVLTFWPKSSMQIYSILLIVYSLLEVDLRICSKWFWPSFVLSVWSANSYHSVNFNHEVSH